MFRFILAFLLQSSPYNTVLAHVTGLRHLLALFKVQRGIVFMRDILGRAGGGEIRTRQNSFFIVIGLQGMLWEAMRVFG